MKKLLFVFILLLVPAAAFAQAAPTDRFQWVQVAPTLAVASAYRYEVGLDADPGTTVLTATCVGATSPFTCSASIPAVTPTTHTARVRAVDTSGPTAITGPFSDPLTFTMRATPAKATGLIIVPGSD